MHSAKWFNDALVIAGGDRKHPTESCSLDENAKFVCIDIEPTLAAHYAHATSFVVDENFCT